MISLGDGLTVPVPRDPMPSEVIPPVGIWEAEPVILDEGGYVRHATPEEANHWGLYFYCIDCEVDGGPGPCHRWHADFSDRETAQHVADLLNRERYHPLHH